MAERCSFDYAVVRVVPRVERQEFINAGVLLFCAERHFLSARIDLDEHLLLTLSPAAEPDIVRRHLEAIPSICAGGPKGGPIGELPLRERWHWLVAPRSTILQMSPPHTGLTDAPEAALDRLFEKLVARRSPR
ncbi:DUF3037 domain-containing protein [Pendulispora albinea]|uniref:DUF3037 domain-containing protein n=1 Tax=Pendulispora albinea TaxID=2741071 RepID=A0ABZ2M9J1_9BACT